MKRRPFQKASRTLASASLVALVGVGLNLAPFTARPAYATNFGSVCGDNGYCVSMANNSDHAIRFQNLTASATATFPNDIPSMQSAANWAIGQYNNTDLVVYRNESDPQPDVWLHDFSYGETGWAGATTCPADNTGTGGSHPNRWCRGQLNRYNSWYYWNANGYFDDEEDRRVMACHELGHTVGLRHNTLSSNSCMWIDVTQVSGPILQPHDISHINARY